MSDIVNISMEGTIYTDAEGKLLLADERSYGITDLKKLLSQELKLGQSVKITIQIGGVEDGH